MLYAHPSAAQKRAALRARLSSSTPVRMPGAFNPLSAKLIEEKDFEGVYVSGAVLSADLGLPDIGLTSVTEIAHRGGQIASMTRLPTVIDADTGFGEPMNAARTTQLLEDAGLSGMHLEDQLNPKRCGHLDGKTIVDEETAVRRVRAAVQARRDPNFLIMARTDMRGTADLSATTARAKALVEAGADALFPEAIASLDEFAAIRSAVDAPILANMTEFGKSDLFSVQQLADAGVDIVIFPVSLLRLAMEAAERGLDTLDAEGSLESKTTEMQTRARLYELVDYQSYSVFDEQVYNFDLDANQQ